MDLIVILIALVMTLKIWDDFIRRKRYALTEGGDAMNEGCKKIAQKEEFLYLTADTELKQQLSEIDALSSKINSLLIICGVCFGIYYELLKSGHYGIVFPGGLMSLPFFMLLYCFKTAKWKTAPSEEYLDGHLETKTNLKTIKRTLVKKKCEAMKDNREKINKISRLINISLLFMCFSAYVAIVLSIIKYNSFICGVISFHF